MPVPGFQNRLPPRRWARSARVGQWRRALLQLEQRHQRLGRGRRFRPSSRPHGSSATTGTLLSGRAWTSCTCETRDPFTPASASHRGWGAKREHQSRVQGDAHDVDLRHLQLQPELHGRPGGRRRLRPLRGCQAAIPRFRERCSRSRASSSNRAESSQLANNKLFISNDIFDQSRQYKPQGSPVIQYRFYGYELSCNYQPNKKFFATFGYSWINGSSPGLREFRSRPMTPTRSRAARRSLASHDAAADLRAPARARPAARHIQRARLLHVRHAASGSRPTSW